MWWWLIIPVIILLCVLVYLLFAPLYIEVNTLTGLYRVRLHRLAGVRLLQQEHGLAMEIRIAWWKRIVELNAQEKMLPVKREEECPKEVPPVKTKKRSGPKGSLKKILAVLRTFRLKECHVDIDSGDMGMNGWLFPVVFFLRLYSGRDLNINFMGRTEVVLVIQNNLARMALAWMRN